MVKKFPLVSVLGHLMGPRAYCHDHTWRQSMGISVEDRPLPQTKQNYFKKREGEEGKRQESFTDGLWMLVQNMSNKVRVWDLSLLNL